MTSVEGCILTLPPSDVGISLSSLGGEGWGEEAALSESLCQRVCAPLPSPLPALRWRGEGEDDGGSIKMRPTWSAGALECWSKASAARHLAPFTSEKGIMRLFLRHARQWAVPGTDQRFGWQAQNLVADLLPRQLPGLVPAPN